jgi:lipoyl-dependent peroxiredoxin
MATDRSASVTWRGSLMEGEGTIENVTSGVLSSLDVDWANRAEDAQGKTSPEELIAAAHAACFAMALSHALAEAGSPPERLETSATVTFVPGTGITKSALTVRGTVPGIDGERFRELAEGARDGCPVSKALTGNVELSVDAELAGAEQSV